MATTSSPGAATCPAEPGTPWFTEETTAAPAPANVSAKVPNSSATSRRIRGGAGGLAAWDPSRPDVSMLILLTRYWSVSGGNQPAGHRLVLTHVPAGADTMIPVGDDQPP